MLCKENQRTFQPKPPDDQGLTKPFWYETFHIRELSIRAVGLNRFAVFGT
jgi:hypothetical protein